METSKNSLHPSQWLALYGDYLYSYALLKVGSTATAEDLVQDTFVSAIRAKESFKGDSSEKTWLVAILKNKIIDHYRKKDVLKNTTEYLSETDAEFTQHFFDSAEGNHWLREAAPQAWSPSADSNLNSKEFNDILQLCIHKMPSRLVPVFISRFIDEEDSDVTCKVHNISPSNYWVIIHRAKVLIRSCLEKNWFLSKLAR
ncbi:MAG: sigma-70 family RNA polymerase sigma factor [Bacteroidota bacterium]